MYLLLLEMPAYTRVSHALTAGGSHMQSSNATLAAMNGPAVYLIIAVPMLASAVAVLPLPIRLRRPADIAGAAIATVFVVLGIASVGLFFLPSAFVLFVIATARPPSRRGI